VHTWCGESVCMVLFGYVRSANRCEGRVVRMTADFARVEMLHQDYMLAPGSAPARGC
jgi:hypothetical protein